MIKSTKLLLSLLALVMVVLVTSCNKETNIGGGGSVPVADGFYITKAGQNPESYNQLISEGVEDGFGSKAREGFYASYMFLPAGNYNLVSVINQEISKIMGGSSTTAKDDGVGCGPDSYAIIEELSDNGAALSIATDGFYKVGFDNTLKEFWVYKIEKAQLNGDALTGIGWDGSVASQMLVVGTPSATEVNFEVKGIELRPNSYKVRFNCNWVLDRTIAPNTATNGYKAFTNIGANSEGAQSFSPTANFSVNYSEDGIYTINAKWTPKDGVVISKTKTTALTFEAFTLANNKWAITGNATAADWPANNDCGAANEDIDFTDITLTGTNFKAEGTFALTDQSGNGFKLRKNDCWDGNKGYADVTLTGTGAAFLENGDGNFRVKAGNAGNYKLTLTTSDYGKKWTLNVVKQ